MLMVCFSDNLETILSNKLNKPLLDENFWLIVRMLTLILPTAGFHKPHSTNQTGLKASVKLVKSANAVFRLGLKIELF